MNDSETSAHDFESNVHVVVATKTVSEFIFRVFFCTMNNDVICARLKLFAGRIFGNLRQYFLSYHIKGTCARHKATVRFLDCFMFRRNARERAVH